MYFRVGTKDWVHLCSVASVIAMNMNLTHVHIFFNLLCQCPCWYLVVHICFDFVNFIADAWL